MSKKRTLFLSIIGMRCPHCREGKLFETSNPYDLRHTLKMPPCCPNCQQDYRIEPGFYFGATYVSYGLNMALFVAVGIALFVLTEPTFWSFTLSWVAFAVVLSPLFARLARSIWIHAFVKYRKEEQSNKPSSKDVIHP